MPEAMTPNTTEALSVPMSVKNPHWFKPGHSGNPKGRPRLESTVRTAFRAQGLESLKVLIELRDNHKTPPAVRLAACNSILDRGFGKPREAPEVREGEEASPLAAADIDALLG